MDVYAFYLLRFWARTEKKNTHKELNKNKSFFFPYYFLIYGQRFSQLHESIERTKKNVFFRLAWSLFWTLSTFFLPFLEINKKNKDKYYFWYCFFQSSAPKRSKKDDHETQIRTPSEFTRALIWQKSTSAISGNQGFLLWGAQSMPWLSGRGKKQPVAWHGGTG